jgi:hypothetical protein
VTVAASRGAKGEVMAGASKGGAWRSASIAFALVALTISGKAQAEESPAAGSPSAVSLEVHFRGLTSLDPAERIEAIRALGDARAESAVEPLARVLRSDPSPEVRGWAVRALAQIGSAPARAALAQAAQHDGDDRVRRLAIQLSGQVTASPFEPPPGYSPGPMVVRQNPFQPFAPYRPRRPGLALIVAGWAAFGVTYLASSIAGIASLVDGVEGTWSLFIPAVGPLVEIGLMYRASEDTMDDLLAPLAVLLVLDAAAQMVGITLGTLGLVRRHRAHEAEVGHGGQEGAVPGAPAAPAEASPPAASSSRRSWGFAVVPAGAGLAISAWF